VLASQVVGPDGARVQGGGVTLDIPAGALPSAQQISIATSSAQPGSGVTTLGPTVQLQPSGLRFAKPVTLTLQVPPGNGLVFWSALGDDKTFEFAGFAHDGLAQATNDHFSIVGSAAEEEDHEAEHSEPEEGDQVCGANDGGGGGGGGTGSGGGGGGGAKCLQLCNCMAQDAAAGALCPTDQGRETGTNCPGNFSWLTSDRDHSNRVVAEGEGLACNGFRYVPVQESLCQCEGQPPGRSSDESLCATTWDGRWQCSSTATGMASDGYEYFAATPSNPLKDRGISAYIGTEGMSCKGYYKPSSPGEPTELITGTMTGCQQIDIDTKWLPLTGMTSSCVEEDRVRCRLTPRQWQMLQQRRADCGFPPRSRTGERDAGPTEGRDKILITTAILVASSGTGYPNPPITGFSSRAQRVLDGRRTSNDSAVANCPAQANLDGKKWADSVGGTAYHAEGGALLRSAEASGYGPGTAPSSPMGVGEMLVDRRPCPLFCRPGGIDKARRAAGLEKLTVHSPGGCLVFTEAAPRGVPCP
jgi:hypothetical protein